MNQLLAMRVFLRVVEAGSFNRAADQLGMPRSSLSKLVSDLEKHLGTQLIHRTTRRIAVTEEGCHYLEQAERIIAAVDDADAAAGGQRHKPSGPLRIDAPVSFAHCLLIPALPDFYRAYPDISVSLGINDRPVSMVGDGVDCAIRAGRLQDMSLIGRKLFDRILQSVPLRPTWHSTASHSHRRICATTIASSATSLPAGAAIR